MVAIKRQCAQRRQSKHSEAEQGSQEEGESPFATDQVSGQQACEVKGGRNAESGQAEVARRRRGEEYRAADDQRLENVEQPEPVTIDCLGQAARRGDRKQRL